MSEKGIPLYIQLKRELKSKIEGQEWKYGEAIPSESVLANIYDVSVGTVRKGIQELVLEGYLVKKWGKGTFVSYTTSSSIEKRKKVVLILPFFDVVDNADIVAGAERVFTDAGFDLVIYSTDFSPDKERELIEIALNNEAEGLLLLPSRRQEDEDELLALRVADVPIVLLDRKANMFKRDTVVYDNTNAGYLVTKHLISLGKKRIAFFVNFIGISSSEDRLRGYIKALKEYDIPIRDEFILHSENERLGGVDRILKNLLACETPPDSIVTVNEGVCLGVWREIRKYKMCPLSDMDIVSIGNAKPWDEFGVPLTTIDLPTYELGVTGARLLMDRIQNPGALRRDYVLPVHLVARETIQKQRAEAF